LALSEELDKVWAKIKNNLLYFEAKKVQDDDNYPTNFINWILEMTDKNRIIYENKDNKEKKDHEIYKKYRQHVYWINFGKNIGSEFNDYHFAVVVRESYFTALVVPISTEKENTPDWKIKEDLIIPIGELNLPNEKKPSYAMIHQMQVVSKKRLDRCGDKKNGYYEVELTNPQMDLIDKAIKESLVNN
jgi:uncharacterized protein YifN (PemK superfamily)